MNTDISRDQHSTSNNSMRWIYVSSSVGLLIIVTVIGIVMVYKGNSTNNHENHSSQPLVREHIVRITNSGFDPKYISIQKGTAIRWINVSDQKEVSVNSDDYPTNKKYPELNLGEFSKDSTVTHTFIKGGTYTYHDQLRPEWRGVITVK